MRTIERDIVGAFILSNDDHILLGKNQKGGVYEDSWVIPGGGIESGETKEEAVAREVLEEVGIDISDAEIVPISGALSGSAEKTLRETGERVIVDMTFFNFQINIDQPANDINIRLEDDFAYAEWIRLNDLDDKKYSPSVETVLKSLNLLG